MNQWGSSVLIWSKAWGSQASASVLVIITVLKIKGLSGVVLCLRGGAWACGNWKVS